MVMAPTNNDNCEQHKLIDLGNVFRLEAIDIAPKMTWALFEILGVQEAVQKPMCCHQVAFLLLMCAFLKLMQSALMHFMKILKNPPCVQHCVTMPIGCIKHMVLECGWCCDTKCNQQQMQGTVSDLISHAGEAVLAQEVGMVTVGIVMAPTPTVAEDQVVALEAKVMDMEQQLMA